MYSPRAQSETTRRKLRKNISCESPQSLQMRYSTEFDKSVTDQRYALNPHNSMQEDTLKEQKANTHYGGFFKRKRITTATKEIKPDFEEFQLKEPGRHNSGVIPDMQKEHKSSYSHTNGAVKTNFDMMNQALRLSDVSHRGRMHKKGTDNEDLVATELKQTSTKKLK